MSELFDTTPTADDRDARLIDAYVEAGRTLDDLPYTSEFESLYAAMGGEAASTRWDLLRRLQNLRKAKKLPRLGRGETPAVRVTGEEEAVLSRLVVEQVGTLGQRDKLLYDARFDSIVQAFNARTGRSLEPHDVWRLVAKLAK